MEASLRDLVLFVHIAAAAVLVGTSVITPMIGRRIASAPTRGELVSWLEAFGLVTRANPLFALVLLASGVWLGSAGWWSQGWFAVSVAAWILSAGLAGGLVKPAATRVAAAAAANIDAPIDAELDALRHDRRWHAAERSLLASDVAILWIMIAKPDLVPSIAILAVAIAMLAGGPMLLPRFSTSAS
ncbi:MAG TPA: DUF2269 family protein [Gammaproteobacteria bacterium]|nr:DUF2269 family protein [Gammaproteobacteria bacterium]